MATAYAEQDIPDEDDPNYPVSATSDLGDGMERADSDDVNFSFHSLFSINISLSFRRIYQTSF